MAQITIALLVILFLGLVYTEEFVGTGFKWLARMAVAVIVGLMLAPALLVVGQVTLIVLAVGALMLSIVALGRWWSRS